MRPRTSSHLAFGLLVGLATLAAASTAGAGEAQGFLAAKHKKLEQITASSKGVDAMREKIRKEMESFVDYEEMSRLTLNTQWEGLDAKQRKEFVGLFKKMIQRTYIKRFEPQKELGVEYKGEEALDGGRVRVKTVIRSGRSSADVAYLIRSEGKRLWVYDIIIDEASQVQNYRRQFKRILDREGWSGLLARMKRNATK